MSLIFTSKQINVPVRVQGPEKVQLIAAGAFHNLALEEDGTLWAWGNNEYGQLGTGDTQPRSQPIRVQGLSGLKLVCVMVSYTILLYHIIVVFSSYTAAILSLALGIRTVTVTSVSWRCIILPDLYLTIYLLNGYSFIMTFLS